MVSVSIAVIGWGSYLGISYIYQNVFPNVTSVFNSGGSDSDDYSSTYVVTAEDGLNVRSGPSEDYEVVDFLEYGTEVEVYSESDGWCEIGDGEYVSGAYLEEW